MNNRYLADTMALILRLEKRKMPKRVKDKFLLAEKGENEIVVPADGFCGVGLSFRKGTYRYDACRGGEISCRISKCYGMPDDGFYDKKSIWNWRRARTAWQAHCRISKRTWCSCADKWPWYPAFPSCQKHLGSLTCTKFQLLNFTVCNDTDFWAVWKRMRPLASHKYWTIRKTGSQRLFGLIGRGQINTLITVHWHTEKGFRGIAGKPVQKHPTIHPKTQGDSFGRMPVAKATGEFTGQRRTSSTIPRWVICFLRTQSSRGFKDFISTI